MRKLVVSEFMTLDGVIEDPGGAEKSPFGGWSMQFFSDEAGKFKFDELFAADAILLGRVTYQGFAAAWPSRSDDAGFADRMNSLPKYVASRTLTAVDWKNSNLIKDDVAAHVRKLKAEPGQDILIAGSGQLVDSLTRDGVIDEYRLMIHPIIVGGGKRLFSEGLERTALVLASVKQLPAGVVILTYLPKR